MTTRRRVRHLQSQVRSFAVGFGVLIALAIESTTAVAAPDEHKLVVVLYPDESDGAPGIVAVNRAIRATFAKWSADTINIRNEYVDTSRSGDSAFTRDQVSLLQRKYAGRKVDLVIAGLSSALDFALAHREALFPGVPIVFVAVDEREFKGRRLPPGVAGIPIHMDLVGTLELALRFHPDARQVYVIAGGAPFDVEWANEARRAFAVYDGRLKFVHLTGLPMDELLDRVGNLPEHSFIYYLHIHKDGAGTPFIPAEALERLAARANAPIYGHIDTYVGRGIVGGRVFTFEIEGENAAMLGVRILAGEAPESIATAGISGTTDMFDWRQLRRWEIGEECLPPGSVVRHREQSFWTTYKWHVIAGASVCLVEALLIAGLMVQLGKRRGAEARLRANQRELQSLTGRLLEAQEVERRRIARELHDDVNQSLALLTVELELLAGSPPERVIDRLPELAAKLKEVSTSIHDLSHQLHPSKLEHLGLVAAINGLCKELHQNHGLDIEFAHSPTLGPIAPDIALCLYRIVQEALRNIIRHSGDHHASVQLIRAADAILLDIADGGRGFDPPTVSDGLGLVSMRERLNQVDGELRIDSRPFGGTRLEVRVPQPLRREPANDVFVENSDRWLQVAPATIAESIP